MTNLTLVSMDDLRIMLSEKTIKNEVWDASQAAEFLKTTEQTVRKEAESGILPGAKVGRAWRFSSIALYEYLSKRSIKQ